jgi:chromosome segregation protein
MLAKLEEANDENLRLVSGNNELRELAGEAESEIASLREQCQSLDETCREALGEGAMARAELELARADSARANKQVEVLKDELANAEEEIRLLAASVGSKEQEKCRLTEGNEEEMRRFAESVEELYALYEAVKDDHVGVKDKVEGAYEETQRKLLDTDGACKKLQQKLREAEGAYEEAQQKIRTKERLCVESQRKLCQTEENLQTLMVDLESVKVELDIVRTKLEDESQENMSKEFTIGGANGKNDIHSSGAVGGKIADTLTPDSEAMGRLKQELEESRAEARRLALSLDTLTARARLESVEKDLELLSPSKSKGSSASSTPSKSNSSPTKSLAKAPSMPSSRESSASPSPTKAPAAKALTVMRDFAIEACVEVDRSTAVCKVFASDGEAYRSEISQSSRRLQDIIQEVGLVLDQVDGRAVETVTSLKGKHNKEVLSLKSALAEVRKEVESLKGELNAAADERKELLLQFDEERSRAVSPKEDAVEPVNSLGEAEKLASESLKRADAADEERRCVAERLETVTLELQRANDACRTLAEQLHEANTRLNAADEGKERIDVLTSELVEVKAVLDAARDRNTKLEGQIRGLLELNAVLEAARERSVELEGRVADADTGVLKLTEACEKLKAQLRETTASLLRAGEEKKVLEQCLEAAGEKLDAAMEEKDATIKALEDEVERVAAEKEAADVAVKKAMKDVEEIRGEFAEALRRASDLESQLLQAKVHSKKAHVQESALEKAHSEQVGQEQAQNEEETLEKAPTTSLDEAIKQVLDLEKALEEANAVIQELKSKVTSLEAARARDEEYTAVEVTSLIKALEERGLDLEKASSCEAELHVKIAELEAALEGRQGKLERLERHVTDLLDSEDALEEQCRSLQVTTIYQNCRYATSLERYSQMTNFQ